MTVLVWWWHPALDMLMLDVNGQRVDELHAERLYAIHGAARHPNARGTLAAIWETNAHEVQRQVWLGMPVHDEPEALELARQPSWQHVLALAIL